MKYKFLLAILFISASIFAGKYAMVMNHHTDVAKAATLDELRGWMWMDNVGWISLSSNNDSDPNTPGLQPSSPAYGVYQDSVSLEWSGDAWSPLLGWIHFSPTSCPPGTDPSSECGAKVVGGQLKGFAEFLTTQPWWDPYISFSSDNDHDSATPGVQTSSIAYGTSVDPISGSVTGYAWHTNGGWLSYFGAKVWPGGQTGPLYLKASDTSAILDDTTIGLAPDPYTTAPSTSAIRLTWMKAPTAPAYTTCSITSNITNVTTPENCPTSINPLETVLFTYNGTLPETYTLSASDGVTTDTVTATVDTGSNGQLCSVNATWQSAPACPPGSNYYTPPKVKWWTNGTTTSCTALTPNTSWVTVSPTVGSSVIQTLNTPPVDGDVYKVQCTDTSMNTCDSPGLPVTYLPVAGFCTDGPPPNTPQCSDGVDNDGDGMVDFIDVVENSTGQPNTSVNPVTGIVDGGDGLMDPLVPSVVPGVNEFQTNNIANDTLSGPNFLDSYADTGCTSYNDNSESRNNVIIKEK